MTTLKSFQAIVDGRLINVDQLHTGKDRQSIAYRVYPNVGSGYNYVVDANKFWSMKPTIKD